MNGLSVALGLFRTPGIGPFLIGRALAATAGWMERITLGWLMWDATGSATAVGVLAFVRLAPSIVLGPLGGVLADRRGSTAILAACQAATVPVALLAAALVAGEVAGPAALLALGAASGVLQALAIGPNKSAVSEVAPRQHLATAIPLSSVTFNAAAFVGPALAGSMIVAFGAAWVFALVAVGAGAFAVILARLPRAHGTPSPPQGAMLAMAEATRAAVRHPVIGPLLWLHVSFSLLMRPIVELLPAVAGKLVGAGPQTLGLLTAAMGLGAFAGSLWLTWRSGSPGLVRPVLLAAVAACLAAFLLALGSGVLQAAACFAALGGALVIRAAGGNTLVQLLVEDRYRGRVMSVWGTTLRIGAALGGLALGALSDVFGMGLVIALAALAALASILPVALLLRRTGLS
jgi:MFS family permease